MKVASSHAAKVGGKIPLATAQLVKRAKLPTTLQNKVLLHGVNLGYSCLFGRNTLIYVLGNRKNEF